MVASLNEEKWLIISVGEIGRQSSIVEVRKFGILTVRLKTLLNCSMLTAFNLSAPDRDFFHTFDSVDLYVTGQNTNFHINDHKGSAYGI